MIDTENIKKFLPKYLSAESYKELIEGLRCFPENLDSRFYTDYLKEKIIYQGDGIKGFPTINFNTMEKKDCQAIVLSNTCDMDLANKRMFGSQIVYAPSFNLEKFLDEMHKLSFENMGEAIIEYIKKEGHPCDKCNCHVNEK